MARKSSSSSGESSRASAPADSAGILAFDSPTNVIRIVVVVPGFADEADPTPMAVETTAGLARLGDPVELLRAGDVHEVRRHIKDPSVDLVLLDRLGIGDTVDILHVLRAAGPPSVVVVAGESEDEAVEAFRAGASDCVQFGPEYERVLPVVLLEQVQRWRADRQRQVSEQRIRRLEDLNTAIVSEMPAGMVVLDPDGLIVAENAEFSRCFPPRSSSGLSSPEFIAARLPGPLYDALGAGSESDPSGDGQATASLHGPKLVRIEDAGQKPVVYEMRRRPFDEGERVLLLITDVTESEWVADRLDALRRDTRDIIENINSALLVVDPDGRISFANPAAERILGGEGDSAGAGVRGRQIADWFSADGETLSPIEACLANGQRSRGAETLVQRADGKWIPIGLSCSPRVDADGVSRGVVAVFQDLSEIKELELQVRQTEKMASIGQLAAGVAHEVNNPMGFIHANLHQMSEYLGDLNKYFDATHRLQTAAIEGDVEVIRAAADDVRVVAREIDLDYVRGDFEKALLESSEGAERIRHIVKDLRDFSRPDMPARTPTDLNQALDSTANIVYTMMKHTVTLEKDYGDLPKIDGYPMQLKQVFMNLLVNAYQAIEVRGADEPGVIRLETEATQDEVVVRVIDSGTGIDPEHVAHIFEPFFTTKPVGAGTGLGLSTSFSIVERHGGRILVDSEQMRGTTFEVRLPIRAPESDAESPSAGSDGPSSSEVSRDG